MIHVELVCCERLRNERLGEIASYNQECKAVVSRRKNFAVLRNNDSDDSGNATNLCTWTACRPTGTFIGRPANKCRSYADCTGNWARRRARPVLVAGCTGGCNNDNGDRTNVRDNVTWRWRALRPR